MLVALAYCQQDQANAQRLLDWIDELGPYPNHQLLLFRERQSQSVRLPKGITIEESTFIDSWNSWPISTTNAFQSVARHIEYNSRQPFLFLEPDCVPLTSDWLDAIEAEYKRAGRPFMGAYVPQNGDVPEHLSGVSVYPGEVIKYAGQALMLDDGAPWDTAVGNAIVMQAHCTDLIQHHWRHSGFKSMEEVRGRITSECRLWHSDKSGSLIELLRKERGDVKCQVEPAISEIKKETLDQSSSTSNGAETVQPLSAPPNDSLTRAELTHDAVAILKQLGTAPRYISNIRKELKRQGVIK